MTKRLISFVVVLALLAACLPMTPVVGAEQTAPVHSHDANHKCSEQCSGSVTWTAWESITSLPAESGHYYLTGSVTLSTRITVAAGKDITICLNGCDITVASGAAGNPYISGKLTIADCTAYYDAEGQYVSGKITGSAFTEGGAFNVRGGGGKLILEGGTITGNTATTAAGAISLQGSGSGEFHMYGGEITGNTAKNGTSLKSGGAIVANNGSKVYIHGGRIYGNTGNLTHGEIYAVGDSTVVQVSGAPMIEKIYFQKDVNSLQIAGLTPGAQIVAATPTNTKLAIKLADDATQEKWDCHWVTVNGKSVSYDGSFKFGHFHGTTEYTPTTAVPTAAGNYYLPYDLFPAATAARQELAGNVNLCLNGHYIAHSNPEAAMYHITGSLTLEDGWAHTLDGVYRSGGIYYNTATTSTATGGSVIAVNGGSFTMNEGQLFGVKGASSFLYASGGKITVNGGVIRDNENSAAGGAVYAANKSTFTMSGGTIRDNQSTGGQAGGIYIASSTVNITGGEISGNISKADGGGMYLYAATGTVNNLKVTGNQSSASGSGFGASNTSNITCKNLTVTGNQKGNGALIIQGSAKVTVSDSVITGNSVSNGGGIYLAGSAQLKLDGVTITGNTAANNGGGIYWGSATSELTVSGNTQIHSNTGNGSLYMGNEAQMLAVENLASTAKIGISNRMGYISQEMTADYRESFFCDNGENVIILKENRLFVSNGHDHCLDGKTDCGHTQENWDTWTEKDSLPTSGSWFLDTDVTLSKTWLVESDTRLCLNGHSITQTTKTARVITVAPGATLTVTDCGTTGTITGGTGILIYRGTSSKGGAELKLYGGTVTGSTQDSTGGIIYLQSAQEGKAGAAFTMYGGEITNNEGTAVYGASGTTVSLEGGTITQNARGVYIHAQAKLSLQGKVVIQGNTGDNLYLSDGAKAQLGTMLAGSNIGVTANAGAFTEPCQDYSDYFTSGSRYQKVDFVDGALHMVAGGEHKHCLCTGTNAQCDHANAVWMAWEKTDTLPTSGSYYLLDDVTLTGEISISNDLTLCLNGHTVKAAEGKRLFSTVKDSGATITITDCGTTGKLTGGMDKAQDVGGGAIYLRAGTHLKLYAGAITGNNSVTAGGAVLMAADCSFYMYGGELSHNGAEDIDGGAVYMSPGSQMYVYGGTVKNNNGKHGGAIYACGRTTLQITGGTFESNHSELQGGALYAVVGCSFTVSGGTYTGNNATQDGGVLYAYGADTLISGGTFTNNTSATSGGALGFSNSSQSKLTGGTYTGNSSPHGGAVIVQGKATLELTGGTVSGNTSTGPAGAVYVNKESTLIMSGGLLEKNTSAEFGGAIVVQKNAVFTMQGGTISGNKATSAGGAIYACSNGSITMTGGSITGNTAVGNGGGIYMVNAVGKLTGGTVSGNYGGKDGGGIFSYTSTLELGGDLKITGNESKTAGGGVAFSRKSLGKITGGIIETNKAPNAGGVIVQGESTVEMTGGKIRFNNAPTGNAGGIYVHTATFTLTDGQITNNSCHKSLGGGMYTYKATVTIAGGAISNNQSYMDGAGAYFNKNSTVTVSGGTFARNKVTKGAGGGFGVSGQSQMTMTGGTVTGNTASNAAGVIIQGQAHLNMYGGTIADNTATNGGGGLYINRSSADLHGGTVQNNKAEKNGGGIYIYLSTVTMGKNLVVSGNEALRQAGGAYVNSTTLTLEGTRFLNNASGTGGGGLWLYLCPEVTLTDICAKGNTCDATGGGVVITKDTPAVMNGGVIEENEALQGGGLVVQNAATGTFTNMIIRNNKAAEYGGGLLTYERSAGMTFASCEIYGNTAGTNGGGVAMMSLRNAHTPDQHVTFQDMKIYDNTASENGGGLYMLKQVWFDGENCDFEGNSAGVNGGGMYIGTGLNLTMSGFKFTGNQSRQTGSALYVGDNSVITDLLVTGNKTEEGAAVYFVKNNYDGESKQQGNYIMCGDVIIKDNEGTTSNLFIDEGTAIATTAEGFGRNTEIHVQLAKGVLTNTILAAYDYEGGNLIYTVTYGDRSLTEPEYEPPVAAETEEETAPQTNQNLWLYIAIGAFGLLAAAAVILVVLKKKKSKV